MSIQYLDIGEFRDAGYLQEANRRFFHPLGLALEANEAEGVLRVWDYRDDPEGIVFALEAELANTVAAHHERIDAEWAAKAAERSARLGYVIQPLEDVARDREAE